MSPVSLSSTSLSLAGPPSVLKFKLVGCLGCLSDRWGCWLGQRFPSCFSSLGPALAFGEALTASEQICGGREVGVFQGVTVGLLLGVPANRTFDTLSLGAILGAMVGVMEGMSPGETKGAMLGVPTSRTFDILSRGVSRGEMEGRVVG